MTSKFSVRVLIASFAVLGMRQSRQDQFTAGHPSFGTCRDAGIQVQGRSGRAFRHGSSKISERIPIPAYTVDDQIYIHGPSVIVATADKFARPAFEPRAAVLFGNVQYHHCLFGFYRLHDTPYDRDPNGHYKSSFTTAANHVSIDGIAPPDLILQDELHLIEGPLGSLFGLYETAVSFLIDQGNLRPAKYIASTATVRRATNQIRAIFKRGVQLFPPNGTRASDRFFIKDIDGSYLDDSPSGRLYMGICAPGKGSLTPVYRIWARLMQTAYENRTDPKIDPYWTLTGYFNAIREVGGGTRALYRQDVPSRLGGIANGTARDIPEDKALELSSGTRSTDLPGVLELLKRKFQMHRMPYSQHPCLEQASISQELDSWLSMDNPRPPPRISKPRAGLEETMVH